MNITRPYFQHNSPQNHRFGIHLPIFWISIDIYVQHWTNLFSPKAIIPLELPMYSY